MAAFSATFFFHSGGWIGPGTGWANEVKFLRNLPHSSIQRALEVCVLQRRQDFQSKLQQVKVLFLLNMQSYQTKALRFLKSCCGDGWCVWMWLMNCFKLGGGQYFDLYVFPLGILITKLYSDVPVTVSSFLECGSICTVPCVSEYYYLTSGKVINFYPNQISVSKSGGSGKALGMCDTWCYWELL